MHRHDAEFLLSRPEFLRFVYEVIQRAGILGNTGAADGRSVRDLDLSWLEGRRSLGREILLIADEGQPDALRLPDGQPSITLHAVLSEAINPKEKLNVNRASNNRNSGPNHNDRSAGFSGDSADDPDERYADID